MKKIKNIEKIRMSKGKESAISYSQKPSFLVSVGQQIHIHDLDKIPEHMGKYRRNFNKILMSVNV